MRRLVRAPDGHRFGAGAPFPCGHVRARQGSEGDRSVQGIPARQSSLELEVKGPKGDIVEWSFVGGSVQQLARLGIGKTGPNALKAGDEITVTCVPAADGKSPIGLLSAITYPDGHTVRFRSPDE
jgi:hypothetical protein